MRSEIQELQLQRQRQRTSITLAAAPAVLDEAFALGDENTWRCDSQHVTEAEKSLEQQLASLAKQSRELTQLLGRLRSS